MQIICEGYVFGVVGRFLRFLLRIKEIEIKINKWKCMAVTVVILIESSDVTKSIESSVVTKYRWLVWTLKYSQPVV